MRKHIYRFFYVVNGKTTYLTLYNCASLAVAKAQFANNIRVMHNLAPIGRVQRYAPFVRRMRIYYSAVA
jgi:hypothetical protein